MRRHPAPMAAIGMAAILLAGCSGTSGNRSQLSRDEGLLRSTRNLLQPTPLPLPRELDKQPLPRYIVEPGDVLLIQPIDLDSPVRLPGDQPVLPDGTINLGRYGLLMVAGRTIEEIDALVRGAVEAQTKNAGAITVRVLVRQSKVYYVLGNVNAPGAFQLTGRETVLDGIIAAGGLNDRASRRHIIMSRPTAPDSCRLVLPICYREIVQHGDTTTNYQLAPGDRIFVPSRSPWEQMCELFTTETVCGCDPPRRCEEVFHQ
jgi:polysaccharide biosynthesis/export protein